jgi:hypothetical protein
MNDLAASPDRREVDELFQHRQIDRDIGNAMIECLRIAEMIRREPQTLQNLLDDLHCSTRTLRRHIARLRRAGYRIRFREDLRAYVGAGFDWTRDAAVRRARRAS